VGIGKTANSKQQTAKARPAGGAVSGADPFAGAYSFRNLAVWQRAQELTDEVLDVIAALPNDRAVNVLSQQILRSASSVAANIAEGHGRYAAGAYRNHLSIARGSTTETIGWIDLLTRRRLISDADASSMLHKCAELMKMLTAKMVDLDKQTGTARGFHDERAEYDVE
jgi:four helix bundle protein